LRRLAQKIYEAEEKKEPKVERQAVWELREKYIERIREVEEQEIREGSKKDSDSDGWWL
jgi:hypothetical protein